LNFRHLFSKNHISVSVLTTIINFWYHLLNTAHWSENRKTLHSTQNSYCPKVQVFSLKKNSIFLKKMTSKSHLNPRLGMTGRPQHQEAAAAQCVLAWSLLNCFSINFPSPAGSNFVLFCVLFCVIYGVNEHKKDNLNRPDSESYLQSTLLVVAGHQRAQWEEWHKRAKLTSLVKLNQITLKPLLRFYR
jgi:hypothetical protein